MGIYTVCFYTCNSYNCFLLPNLLMAKNQQALKRYRIILKVLGRGGKHSSNNIHISIENSGIEVGHRTVQQDLKDLRDDHSIFGKDLTIQFDKSSKKWFCDSIPTEIYSAIELDNEEIDALMFYTKAINQYKDYPIFKDITDAIKKVISSSNISVKIQDLFEKETLLETENHGLIKGIDLIPAILEALHERKTLTITYRKFDHIKSKSYEIIPILLKEDKKLWYLIGMNTSKNRLTTLALDRIENLLKTDNEFTPIEFDSEKYFEFSFGITVHDEPPEDVVISFTPDQGNYLKILPLHSTQEILFDNVDEFRILVKVKPSYEFYSKIKSYGDQATIISPKSVAETIQNTFKQALNNYKTD